MRWLCIPLLLAIIQPSHLCSETDKVNKNLPLPPWTLFPLWTLIMNMNTQSYICMLYDSMHMYVYMCAHMYAYTCMAAGTVIMQMLSFSWHPLHWGNTLQWFTFLVSHWRTWSQATVMNLGSLPNSAVASSVGWWRLPCTH